LKVGTDIIFFATERRECEDSDICRIWKI